MSSFCVGSEEAVLTGVGSTIEIYIIAFWLSRLIRPGSDAILTLQWKILRRSEFTVRDGVRVTSRRFEQCVPFFLFSGFVPS